uniref:breakpoint cluster region protein-like n=1 Tax=Callithrix jacchus TaxID=9483 RepID=UPI00159DC4C5|nr:breakpoint cluster region protein-like [Callithrix jacchus]
MWLPSREEDFSYGQSSRVSPSPTTYCMFRDKSHSPWQNSQQSSDSSKPSPAPTPQCHKRHWHCPVVMSEATIVGVRKAGQIWPNDGRAPSIEKQVSSSNLTALPLTSLKAGHSRDHPSGPNSQKGQD